MAKQTHKDYEHIVVDGGSTDRTLEIIQKQNAYKAKILEKKIEGIYAALNHGIVNSNGKIIGILHGDDQFMQNDVLQQVNEEFKDPTVMVVYGDLEYVDPKNNRVTRRWKVGENKRKKWLWGWSIPHTTTFIRREVFDHFGYYLEHYKIAGDYDFLLRVCYQQNLKSVYLPKTLVRMNKGGISNVSFKNRMIGIMESMKVLKSFQLKTYPIAFILKPLRKFAQFIQ